MSQLTSGERFTHLDRVFRNRPILEHEQIFFPFLKQHHFMLITVLPNHNGRNYIRLYDSFASYNCENELQFIQAYLQHAATLLDRDEFKDWTIERKAVQDMERQADSISCGIYVCMFVDCLTTGIPVNLLTQTT